MNKLFLHILLTISIQIYLVAGIQAANGPINKYEYNYLKAKHIYKIRNFLNDKVRSTEFHSYVNDVTNRKFSIYRNSSLWKIVPYNSVNQLESFGQVTESSFYSYVNDVTNRKFSIYRNGSLWKTVSYNSANETESFGGIGSFDFYSYVNDVTSRSFRIYKNGTVWKTIPYNSTSHVELFGGIFNEQDLYSYVNDMTNSRFIVFKNGALWKTIPFNIANQAELFGGIMNATINNTITKELYLYSYVNDAENRRFQIYKDGTVWKTMPYKSGSQTELFGDIRTFIY